MKQDMIVILDLGSTENTVVAREIRSMGVYSEIHPHDIGVEGLKKLENVKGIILNGGENRVVDGAAVDVDPALYECGIPVIAIDHPTAKCTACYDEIPDKEALKAFVFGQCHAEANWNMKNFTEDQVELMRRQVGDRKVLLALSGGVDSSVVAALLLKAIGNQLVCVHVNHGLMRKNESESVVEVFKNQLHAAGVELGLPHSMVYRQPFPGPGLGVRCLGAITRDRLEAVRESDAILRDEFEKAGLDQKVWQYFTVVPNFKSVGVKHNARSFEYMVIIRAINTIDAMSASVEQVPWDVLLKITDRILDEVENVNRVCYDLSPKPPATIEWE